MKWGLPLFLLQQRVFGTHQGATVMEVIANQLTMYEERLAQQTREFRQTQVLAHQAAFRHTVLQLDMCGSWTGSYWLRKHLAA